VPDRLRWTFDHPSPLGRERLLLGYGNHRRSVPWQDLLNAAVSSFTASLVGSGALDATEELIEQGRLLDTSELRLYRNDLFAVPREVVGGEPVAVLLAEWGEGRIAWPVQEPSPATDEMLSREQDDLADINGDEGSIVLPRPGTRNLPLE
jgi:hypothetical protein